MQQITIKLNKELLKQQRDNTERLLREIREEYKKSTDNRERLYLEGLEKSLVSASNALGGAVISINCLIN